MAAKDSTSHASSNDNMGVVLYRLGQLENNTTKQNEAILAKLESITSNYMPRADIIERDNAIIEDLTMLRSTWHDEHMALLAQLKDLEQKWEKNSAGISFANMLVARWVQLLIGGIIFAALYAAAAHYGR